MREKEMMEKYRRTWLVRNVQWLKSFIRIVFGVAWLVDGYFKFLGDPESYAQMIQSAADGQPGWLQPWFNLWYGIVSANPVPFVYIIGIGEIALALALVFGFMRRIAYTSGMLLSLVIWSVPEGFGGPYGPGSSDIGTGIVYSFVFLCLLIINAAFGQSKFSLDAIIERRFPFWARLAEVNYVPTKS